ncbi:MAG: glycine zipper 2TM domain-containing protein [Pseudomonadota bacterium]
MKRKVLTTIVLLMSLALAGCATQGPREESGMVIGGLLGGLLGAQADDRRLRPIAIIAGTLIGSSIGGSIGSYMDETDRLRAGQTLETVRTGVSSSWRNPDNGVQYQFTPTHTYETAQGPCREYTMEALIGGRREQVYGTACRQPDGSWQIMN